MPTWGDYIAAKHLKRMTGLLVNQAATVVSYPCTQLVAKITTAYPVTTFKGAPITGVKFCRNKHY